MSAASQLTRQHLDKIRGFYDEAPATTSVEGRYYRSWLARYYNLYLPAGASVLEIGCGSGELLAQLRAGRKVGVDLSAVQLAAARARVPDAEFQLAAGEDLPLTEKFDCIIISDTLNLAADVQQLLERLHQVCHADTRLIINYYSSLWRPLLAVGGWLGLRSPQPQYSWLSNDDVRNLNTGVVDVILRLHAMTARFQHADERVAERRVAQVPDVRGFVRIDVGMFDDDFFAGFG